MDWAFIRREDKRYLVGYGPFQARQDPPKQGVAFFRSTFDLSERKPWFVPETTVIQDELEGLLPENTLEPQWNPPHAQAFTEVFGQASTLIQMGKLEKSVPAMAETGSWNGPGASLARALHRLPAEHNPYGWKNSDEGLLGASPELLLTLCGTQLSTMALAGTARAEDRDAFAYDPKEIREHEYVAQNLTAKLSDLGSVERKARAILDLGSLVHFHSAFSVELRHPESPGALIRKLHPTPALGPLPRTQETLRLLNTWRQTLSCPAWFGAPFGVSVNDNLRILVAIRMLHWKGKKISLPAGCGVIEASRLVNEWRELRLKREVVRKLFEL